MHHHICQTYSTAFSYLSADLTSTHHVYAADDQGPLSSLFKLYLGVHRTILQQLKQQHVPGIQKKIETHPFN